MACHASKKISKVQNCLISGFQRCWAHTALSGFNPECVRSAASRSKHLEPMQRHTDQEVRPQSHLSSPSGVAGRTHPMDRAIDVGSRSRHGVGHVLPFPTDSSSPAHSAQVQSAPVMNMDLWHWWVLKGILNSCMSTSVEVASRRLVKKKKMQLSYSNPFGLLAVKTDFMLCWTMTFNIITEKKYKTDYSSSSDLSLNPYA